MGPRPHTGRHTAAATLVVCAALCGAPTAAAQSAPVAAGDQIEAHTAAAGERCTLGYTFTDPATGTTYGVTAGHCNPGGRSGVIDQTTGATGRFILSTHDPDTRLGDDYGLIDFGASPPRATLQGMPIAGVGAPTRRTTICHTGIRTGVACGDLDGTLTASQYLTSGMPPSIPGDSGGPVWQLSRGGAVIVGIWLGEHQPADGSSYGRFMNLPDVLTQIGSPVSMAS